MRKTGKIRALLTDCLDLFFIGCAALIGVTFILFGSSNGYDSQEVQNNDW